jgi:hypothetical protein
MDQQLLGPFAGKERVTSKATPRTACPEAAGGWYDLSLGFPINCKAGDKKPPWAQCK